MVGVFGVEFFFDIMNGNDSKGRTWEFWLEKPGPGNMVLPSFLCQ